MLTRVPLVFTPQGKVVRANAINSGKIQKMVSPPPLDRSSFSGYIIILMAHPLKTQAGKSIDLKVNPIFERVGDYTKDVERREIDVRLNIISLLGIICAIAALELDWRDREWENGNNKINRCLGTNTT